MEPPVSASATMPILLTSSIIAHDQSVKLNYTGRRLRHAIESIEQWLRIDPQLHLVLCDGSNFDLQTEITHRFAGATIEFLRFENNQEMVSKYGRGYGEGEIVRYALENSSLITKAGCFAKCSSKLWVANFMECQRWWNGDLLFNGIFMNVFTPFKPTFFYHIDTRFYMASVSLFQRYFLNAHRDINVESGYGLEECFHDIVLRERMRNILLPVSPVIQGVGGGTASYYKNSLKRIWKERLRIALLRRIPEFKILFSSRPKVKTDAFFS